ncbi:MAG: exosome complex protein Rrp42 [Candidatus Micrarchaeota archaeon]|nr:exosome complex protein Rrp42 [Candidatus Micrarchaeota archaeon]
MQPISVVKGEYVRELLNKGIREEGRGMLEYRSIGIKHSVLQNAEGSAQVDMGSTKVLVGIKLDMGEPMSDKPNEGNLMTMAELLPLASPEYETGPPSPDSIELARVVDRGIRAANVIDLPALFIEEGKVWNVFVDIYVLNYDGNLFDACALAAMTALSNTRMPKYDKEKDEVIREGSLGKLKINNVVTSCTYAKMGNKIVLDADGAEESIMEGRVTIANDEKVVRAMQKGKRGAFSQQDIEHLMEKSFEKSKELRRLIENAKGE